MLDGASFSNSGLSNSGSFQSLFVVASWNEQEQYYESFVVFEDVVVVVVIEDVVIVVVLDSVERDDSAAAESVVVGVVDFVDLSTAAADSECHFATILAVDIFGAVCVAVVVSYAAGDVAVVA